MAISKSLKTSIPLVSANEGCEAIHKVLQEHGCVIVQEFLTPDQVLNINRDVDPHITKIQMSRRTYQEEYWVNMKRQGHLALISKTYREDVLNHPIIHGISERTFVKESGDYWLATSAVLETSPGYTGQKLHREHDGIPICTAMGRGCPETMFNFLIALTPFTDDNGATRIIPGSEKWDNYYYQPSLEEAIPVEMNAGDAVLFGGKVLHGAGENRSKDCNRRSLPIVMQSGYFTPVEASAFLPRNVVESMTPLAQKMIGWRSVKCQDIELWSLHMNELGKQLGLKSSQPIQEDEIDKQWLSYY